MYVTGYGLQSQAPTDKRLSALRPGQSVTLFAPGEGEGRASRGGGGGKSGGGGGGGCSVQ